MNADHQMGGNNLQKSSSGISNNSFFKHVTRFDSETKSELSNLLQYLVIIIIPIYILNRFINGVIPNFNENKGNVELLGEVIMQVISLLLGVYIIHRIVLYIPTFSGNNLLDVNFMNLVLIIIFSGLNSENGKKVNHVYNRLMLVWNGKKKEEEEKKNPNDNSVVKVSQPIAGNPMQAPQATHQASRADYVNTHQQMGTGALSQVVQQIQTGGQQMQNAVGVGGQQGSMGNSMGGGLLAEPMASNAGFGAFSSF